MTTALLKTEQLADRLKIEPETALELAKRRILPKIQPNSRVVRFDWTAVSAVLSALTVWELQHGHDARTEAGEIVSREELAAAIGKTENEIRGLMRSRFIPYIRLGRLTRYDLEAVRYALANLISPADCARRLGVSRLVLASMSGPGHPIPVNRIGRKGLRYHWPTVQLAMADAGRKATVIPLGV